jgi:hypothetical protein
MMDLLDFAVAVMALELRTTLVLAGLSLAGVPRTLGSVGGLLRGYGFRYCGDTTT